MQFLNEDDAKKLLNNLHRQDLTLDQISDYIFPKVTDCVYTKLFLDEIDFLCGKKFDTFDWIQIMGKYRDRLDEILEKVGDENRSSVLMHCADFNFDWIQTKEMNLTKSTYIKLSKISALRNLPLSFVDENNGENWSFSILSQHPALTVDFIDKYREKEWCYFTLFDRGLYKPDKEIYICTMNGTIPIKVPSYFELYSIRRHPDIDTEMFNNNELAYFNKKGEEYSYDMKISDLKDPYLFILIKN